MQAQDKRKNFPNTKNRHDGDPKRGIGGYLFLGCIFPCYWPSLTVCLICKTFLNRRWYLTLIFYKIRLTEKKKKQLGLGDDK